MTVNKYTNISTPYLWITTHLNVNILMVIYQSFQCADFFDHKEESTAPTLINIYIYFFTFYHSKKVPVLKIIG